MEININKYRFLFIIKINCIEFRHSKYFDSLNFPRIEFVAKLKQRIPDESFDTKSEAPKCDAPNHFVGYVLQGNTDV